MKTLVLFSAVSVLGLLGCSHAQQASRSQPAANELPYHQPGRFGPQSTPAADTGEDATGGSGAAQPCPDTTTK